jgi:hypothetical protein
MSFMISTPSKRKSLGSFAMPANSPAQARIWAQGRCFAADPAGRESAAIACGLAFELLDASELKLDGDDVDIAMRRCEQERLLFAVTGRTIFALLLVLSASAAWGGATKSAQQPQAESPERLYYKCILKNAQILAVSSGEPAEIIARAATRSCGPERDGVIAHFGGVGQGGMEMMEQFDEKIIPDLLFAVITARANQSGGHQPTDRPM